MNPIKSEPIDNSSLNTNGTYQQELISTNGKTTLKTTKPQQQKGETAKLPITATTTPIQSTQNTEITTNASNSATDPTDIEKNILELCKQYRDGISDQLLQAGMPNISSQQRLAALNRLLSLNKIDLLKSSKSGHLFRLKDLDADMKGNYDADEKLIYSIIKESNNKGIWVRDITSKTNLKTTVLNKILKSLESKKLIKSVTSVNAGKKKVYMLFDLEPDRSLTGGSWYNGKDFESEFVEILNEQCYLYLLNKKSKASEKVLGVNKKSINDPLAIRNASYATTKELKDYIKNLGISRVELNLEDIETILNTLVFDGKIERTVMHTTSNASNKSNNEQTSLYRAINPIIPLYNANDDDDDNDNNNGDNEDDVASKRHQMASLNISEPKKKKVKGYGSSLVRIPCGICPVIGDCHEDGQISPKTCIYMKEWLEF